MTRQGTSRGHYRKGEEMARLYDTLRERMVRNRESTKSVASDVGVSVTHAAKILRCRGCAKLWLAPEEVALIEARRRQ